VRRKLVEALTPHTGAELLRRSPGVHQLHELGFINGANEESRSRGQDGEDECAVSISVGNNNYSLALRPCEYPRKESVQFQEGCEQLK
jgi:hypothetical protein